MGDRGRTGLERTCGTPPPTPLPQGEGEKRVAGLASRRAGASAPNREWRVSMPCNVRTAGVARRAAPSPGPLRDPPWSASRPKPACGRGGGSGSASLVAGDLAPRGPYPRQSGEAMGEVGFAVIASAAEQSPARYAPGWGLPRRFAPRNDRGTGLGRLSAVHPIALIPEAESIDVPRPPT